MSLKLKTNRPSTDAAAEETTQVNRAEEEVVEETTQAGNAVEPEVGEVDEGTAGTVEPEAEPQAQATATASDVEAPRHVTVRNESQTQVAVATGSANGTENYFKQMVESLKADGQNGLEMGYGVFPVVSLDKGEFKINDEEFDDDFTVVPMTSEAKFAYRTTGVPEKEVEVTFSDTDRAHLDPGSAVSQRLLEWKEKWPESGFEIKKYLDVYAYVVELPAKPELQGQIVVLSVSPTSIRRYTNACVTAKGRGYAAHECVFKVAVGEKVRGDFDYYPWEFQAIGSCRKLGVEVKFGGQRDEDF